MSNLALKPRTFNRRNVVAGAALEPMAIASAAFATDGSVIPKDKHRQWLRCWQTARDRYNTEVEQGREDSPTAEMYWDQLVGLEKLLAGTAPTTPDGAAAVTEWVLAEASGDFVFSLHEVALNSLQTGLRAMV